MSFPKSFEVFNFRKPVNTFIEDVVIANADVLDEIASSILVNLLKVETLLRQADWRVVLSVVFALSWGFSRKLRVSLLVTGCFVAIGMLGMWDKAMQTLSMLLICLLAIVCLGFPLGIWMHVSQSARRVLTVVMDLLQTMPSFVYLVPAIMFFGLGKVPAILATVLYAIPPIARFTDIGLSQVNAENIEAASAFGFHPVKTLFQIKIPLAMPTILGGLNQGIMMTLAMVVVASLVGARGLGEPVLYAIQRLDIGLGLQGGLAITLLAIAFDRFTASVGQRWIPPV